MGTRSLTMVIDQEGQTKVAQYGQWDGYPSGVGSGVLKFISNKKRLQKLKKSLSKLRFIDFEGKDKQFIEEYDKNAPEWSNDPDNRTDEQKRWWKTFISRDLSDTILTNIIESSETEIILKNSDEGGKTDIWIEWTYVIDFKKNRFEVYDHYCNPEIKSYDLDSLPTQSGFLKDLEESDEEE